MAKSDAPVILAGEPAMAGILEDDRWKGRHE